MKNWRYVKEFFGLITWSCFFFAFLFVANYNGEKPKAKPDQLNKNKLLQNDDPIIDKNAYIVDGDTLATENI